MDENEEWKIKKKKKVDTRGFLLMDGCWWKKKREKNKNKNVRAVWNGTSLNREGATDSVSF